MESLKKNEVRLTLKLAKSPLGSYRLKPCKQVKKRLEEEMDETYAEALVPVGNEELPPFVT